MIPSRLLVVTDRHGSDRPLTDTVRAALDGGARWIWFRDKDMEGDARRALAVELLSLVHAAGGTLTIGGDAVLAAEIGADGVQLSGQAFERLYIPQPHPEVATRSGALEGGLQPAARSLEPTFVAASQHLRMRVEVGESFLTGASAHSLGDVRTATAAGLRYVTLSPIFPTASKPGYGPALGLDGLRAAAAFGLPVVALGGVTHENACACVKAGATGVAVMGAIMRAADPAAETRRLLAALGAT